MQEINTKKIKIVPNEAPGLVCYVIKNIKQAIKNKDSQYSLTPGIDYVKKIVGTTKDGIQFKLVHITKKKRGDIEKIYALYNRFEFICPFVEIGSDFIDIDNYINETHVYDANTDSYYKIPDDPKQSIWDKFRNAFKTTNEIKYAQFTNTNGR